MTKTSPILHRYRQIKMTAWASVLPLLILAVFTPRTLYSADTWANWIDTLEIRVRDLGGQGKIPDPGTFGNPGHPFAPPHPYSTWPLNFLQIGSTNHPQIGSALSDWRDYAGAQIARDGINDDVFVLELINNSDFGISVDFSVSTGFIPGPGIPPVRDGVPLGPNPVVPLPDFRPYPEIPYPNLSRYGNISGTYIFNSTGSSLGAQTAITEAMRLAIPPSATFGPRYLVFRLTPNFPGAWKAGLNFAPFRVIEIGGVAEPPPTRRPVVLPLVVPNPVPSTPSESRFIYRIYNVGSTPLTLNDITFASAPSNEIRLIDVLDQSGAIMPDKYPKPYGLPTIIPAYDGTPSFTTGPLAYSGGSSPVAPWVDVIIGVSPPQGPFFYTVVASYGSPLASTQWTISGSGVLSPEITAQVGGVFIVSNESILSSGSLVNEVPGRGREYAALISNIGNQPLNLGVPSFVSDNASGQVLPGGSWDGTAPRVVPIASSVTLRFRVWPEVDDPSDSGPFALEVQIPTNDLDENPFIIRIQGNATPRLPRLEVVRNSRSIPNNGVDIVTGIAVNPNPAMVVTYTLQNTGDRPLTIASINVGSSTGASIAQPVFIGTTTLPAVNPQTLTVGATETFDLHLQASNERDSVRVRLEFDSNNGSVDPVAGVPFILHVTDYKSDGGEGRKCGFGSPFSLLLLIGGLQLWRRRQVA